MREKMGSENRRKDGGSGGRDWEEMGEEKMKRRKGKLGAALRKAWVPPGGLDAATPAWVPTGAGSLSKPLCSQRSVLIAHQAGAIGRNKSLILLIRKLRLRGRKPLLKIIELTYSSWE